MVEFVWIVLSLCGVMLLFFAEHSVGSAQVIAGTGVAAIIGFMGGKLSMSE